ncbi:SDR family NAD(P)-dependent oxidoreductase [Patescibacteria group bacterium]|nr:SDR family NAD(P)-dependent oxidoreductase [Patescibacteria group bacterium]
MRSDTNNRIKETDIAIIGMSCRFPGAQNVEVFWENLKNSKESISFFTNDELENGDKEIVKDPHFVKAGSVLDEVKSFDAGFFGFSEQDAKILDPQHRKFLECSWEALEDGGYNPDVFKGSIGVFGGSGMSTYFLNNVHPNIGYHPNRTFLESMGDLQLLTANDRDYLTTRAAYKLNLRGPSINVQTACSTSLVAVHLACQSILNGECDMALAGAVTILCPQKTGYLYQQDMILSPDGHCRPFDAKAKGTVFGSGVGVILLKRFSDAIHDGDAIHAVIKGTAVNNDGAVKVGYSAPSVNGQSAVIEEAMAVADVEPTNVTYIEAHGTATQIGDLVEVTALKQAFQTEKRNFCALGSVKSNVGHLAWASGMAGLIKVILALKHKKIPATLNFEKANSQIDLENSPFYVNADLVDWETDSTRTAGVSAFGLGGTNAHIVLSEVSGAKTSDLKKDDSHIFTLSARNEGDLRTLAERYVQFLNKTTEVSLVDICYTSNIGRRHLDKRLGFVVSSVSELQEKLRCFIDCVSIQKYVQSRLQSSAAIHMSERAQVLVRLAQQYESGVNVDWGTVYTGWAGQRVHMPTYPFQRNEYWIESIAKLRPAQRNEQMDLAGNLYDMQYEKLPLYGSASRYLPSVQQLSRELNKRFKEIAVSSGMKGYTKELNLLEKISYQMIINAFVQLGCKFDVKNITTEEFVRRFNVVPQYKKLIDRFFEILEEEGVASRDDFHWKLLKKPKIADVLLTGQKHSLCEFDFLNRCGSNLADVLRGVKSPLDLLFPNGDTSLLKKLYSESPTLKAMNMLVAEAVSLLEQSTPKKMGLRILEIGSGTGSATASVLSKLSSSKTDYTFTDLSNSFISEAKNNFVDYSCISYAQLDIEKTPSTQGFSEEKYDVIIAANVLHATQDLRGAISNVNKLLAPGGILILLEGTAPVRWVDLTFGLTDGWWHFTDYDLRSRYPLLPPKEWERELLNHGFAEVETLTSEEIGSSIKIDGGLPQAVILAKKNSTVYQSTHQTWVIFADRSGTSDILIKRLTERGDNCIVVQRGDFFREEVANQKYTINLFRPEDFEDLFEHIQQPIHNVLYLWSLDEISDLISNLELLKRQYLQDCGGLLNTVKSILNKLPTPPALFVITQGAQCLDASSGLGGLLQSSVWGMHRVITVEHPELCCKIIDIESTKQVTDLVDELFARDKEHQVILKSDSRYVSRITRASVNLTSSGTQPLFKEDAVYIITGGLGGLGIKVAEWMAGIGARHIALVGRHEPTDDVKEKINLLIKKGIDIHVAKCDVSNYESLKSLFFNLKQIGPVKGIIHAAGVIDDGILLQQDFERLLKPAYAKVFGSWNLHILSQDESINLDFFILFSSVVSTIGNVGQSNHASANSFMNNLALYRKYQGLPATVIQWGAWADIGTLAKYPDVVEKLNTIGFGLIQPAEGVKVLEFILRKGITAAIFAPINWERFLKFNKSEETHLFASLVSSSQRKPEELFVENFVSRLALLTGAEQLALIERKVAENVSRILGLQQESGFEDKDFFDYGMDSLTSIQLRNNLQSDFKCSLHPTLAYKYPTVRKLSEYIVSVVRLDSRSGIISTNQKEFTSVSGTREISMQQRRWIRLAAKDYGRLLVPILFHAELNKKAFLSALEQVVNRHEVLKYRFLNDQAFVVDAGTFLLNDPELFVDASNETDQALVIKQQADNLRFSPPDPRDRPTWMIRCIRLNKDKFLVLLHIQHLEFDGASISIFVDDLRMFYSDFVNGIDATYLPAVQYADYVEWQKHYLNSDISEDREFFKKLFSDTLSSTILPNHSGRSSTESYPSACYTPSQIKGLWRKLQAVGKKMKTSPFAILCSTYAQLVGEIVNNDHVVIGTIVSSRPSCEFERTIGPFVQPFPMKISLNDPLRDMISTVHTLVTEINERSGYPVADMINHIPAFKEMEIDTYFTDSFIMLNNYSREADTQPRVEVFESLGPILEDGLSGISPKKINEIAGLFLIVDYYEGEMRFNFWYHSHRFFKKQVQEWADRYSDLLKQNIQSLEG